MTRLTRLLLKSTIAALLAAAIFLPFSAPAMASGYDYTGYSSFNFRSAEGTAHAVGEVKWYEGNTCSVFIIGCIVSARIIRGEYHGSVNAGRPTDCLWVRVEDFLGGLRPGEGTRALVPVLDPVADVGFDAWTDLWTPRRIFWSVR